jgi:transposase
VRTDKVDSLKIAGYCLDKWAKLERYAPVPENRQMLKTYNRQLSEYTKIKTMLKNNLISLLDNDFSKTLITQTVNQLNSLCETIAAVKSEMSKIASTLPEYNTVLAMYGVGKTLAPQLIAEIGDIRRYPKRSSLARFAGIEPPENQSGTYNQHSRRISKQGSPHLRKTLFMVMCCVLQTKNPNEPTFQFIDRKRSEGKPYKVYMIAGANKFLRIYYARVNECFNKAA